MIDHQLPTSVATFVSFYDSWITRLREVERPATVWRRLRRPLLNTFVDAALLVAVVIGAAWARPRVSSWLGQYGVNATVALVLLVAVALGLGVLFAFGIARHAIRLAHLLAREVIPLLQHERDLGRAPRRAFEIALELVALLVVGLPIAAITQPFVPGGALVVVAALAVIAFLARRSLADLDQHVRAGAELIVEVLARQGSDRRRFARAPGPSQRAHAGPRCRFSGARQGSPAIGKSLAQLDLRAKTGASVLAIRREGGSAANPSPHEALREGDVLALADQRTPSKLHARCCLVPPSPKAIGTRGSVDQYPLPNVSLTSGRRVFTPFLSHASYVPRRRRHDSERICIEEQDGPNRGSRSRGARSSGGGRLYADGLQSPSASTASDAAASMERTRCGPDVDESRLLPVVTGGGVDSVEPLYTALPSRKSGSEMRLYGAVIRIRATPGITARVARSRSRVPRRAAGAAAPPEDTLASNPFWLPGRMVDIDTESARDSFKVAVRGNTTDDAQEEILIRATAYLATNEHEDRAH